jgi:phospholipid/cholesterol/gamma-HCH transport system permease protein
MSREFRREFLSQLYAFGNGCLGIVALCVSFMGVIVLLEYSYHMKIVLGNDSLVPGFAMLLLVRELAPVVTALLITSKMGAGMAAELAAMKNTEQLDAYRLLGLDIVQLYVLPRVAASAVATLALVFISLFCSLVGAFLASTAVLHFAPGPYLHSLQSLVDGSDFALMSLKAVLFGLSVPALSAWVGLRARFGAEGVGAATTDAVVACSLWILGLDFALTWLFTLRA